ncbi:hypothetical protein J3F84DRAFT_392847 [Trichoderma pleuroticola]
MPLLSSKLVGRLSCDYGSQDDTESKFKYEGPEHICSNRVARTVSCRGSSSRYPCVLTVFPPNPSRPFKVSSEDQIRPSANTRNETDESLIGKTGGDSSNNSMPKNMDRALGVSQSVEGQVASSFRHLSPHVRARSITDRQAWLARINAQRKQWPFSD